MSQVSSLKSQVASLRPQVPVWFVALMLGGALLGCGRSAPEIEVVAPETNVDVEVPTMLMTSSFENGSVVPQKHKIGLRWRTKSTLKRIGFF